MDNFRISSLISQKRIVRLTDIDPTKAYAQIGVYQEGNTQWSPSSPGAYPSYTIPLSELLSPPTPDLKKYILVDSAYGNDGTAVPYDTHNPYRTIDAAVAAASFGDTIVMNPGTYYSFSNIMRQSQNYYCMPGVQWFIYNSNSLNAGESLGIYGYGNINWVSVLDARPGYTGNITIECETLIFQNYAFLDALAPDVVSRIFRIRAKNLTQNGVTGMIVMSPWVLDIEAYNYIGNVYGPGGAGIADFWMNNDFSAGQENVSSIRFENANVNHAVYSFWGDASFINCSLGLSNNKLFVDINNLLITNNPLSPGGPFMLRVGPSGWQTYINVNKGVLNNCTMVLDQSTADARLLVQGKYWVNIPTGLGQQYTPFWIGNMTLECKADVIASIGDNPIIEQYLTGKIDIVDCKLINTGIAGTEIGIRKNGGAATKLRLKNAKILAATSIIGLTGGGEDVELYSCYTNSAPVNVNNTLAPSTAFVVNAAMTDNNF